MKNQKTELMGLHCDILKEVMIRVARSSDGAKDFAKAMSVCKGFREFVKDEDVLKAVAFDGLIIGDRWELFQVMGGLICRCAKAGQVHAQFILSKIILASTLNWVVVEEFSDDDKADSAEDAAVRKEIMQGYYFLENFLHPGACANWFGHHFDIVKIFLCRARCSEYNEMHRRMVLYMHYVARFLREKANQDLSEAYVKAFYKLRSWHEMTESETLKLVDMLESEPLIFEIPGSPMARMELVTNLREEIRGAHTDVMVLDYDMLLKMLRAMKDFMQRINASPSPQKLEETIHHIKELECRCLMRQRSEANLLSIVEEGFSRS